jgi:tetratricopeptide (TPR) repeat protein
MNRDNLLFAIIGILFGFIVGFMFASTMNQRQATPMTAAQSQQAMPADHPAVGNQAGAPQANGQMQATVLAALEKARSDPKNFEAQMEAAGLYYQIQRYDQAIEYLLKANELKPDDFQTVALLGEANMDAGHFEVAERWYRAALVKKPEEVPVLDGLCAVLLQEGKAKDAEEMIAKLAKADANNSDLTQFRDRLAGLKTGKK